MSPFATSWKKLATGYLLVLIVILGVLGAVHVLTWRDSVADRYRRFAERAAEYLDLGAGAREEVLALADRVLGAFRDGTLGDEQLGRLLGSFEKSPLASVLVFVPILERHVEGSGLAADEKEGVRRDVRRLCRGLLDGSVAPEADLPAILKAVPRVPGHPDRMDFEAPMTDEEIRALFTSLSGLLEAKQVSEIDGAGDVLAELHRIADASGLPR